MVRRVRIMPMTTPAIPWFRELCDDITQYRRHLLFYDVLIPWIEKAQPAITDLARFKTFSPIARTDQDSLNAMWNLYALSRVNDLLLLPFQDENGKAYTGPTLNLAEYTQFFARIGFTVVEADRFSPFHHEVLRVHQSKDEDEAVGVVGHIWPGLMFGDMLFSRSGVEVIGGRKHIVREIAQRSTLYFTYRRLNRPTADLSMGWGSNSQWRTSFRRDYESDGMRIYNADAKNNLLKLQAPSEQDRDGLTLEERIELCRNRCFIITPKPDQDLWPYDDRFEEYGCS
jgi:hypothetical protein